MRNAFGHSRSSSGDRIESGRIVLRAYVFEFPMGFKDGRGPVILVAHNLVEARDFYKRHAVEKHQALLKSFGKNISVAEAAVLAEEDLNIMTVKEIPLVLGVIILDEGI